MSPNQKKAGWLAIAIAAVGAYEGLSLKAYPDIVGVPTICYGETKNVKLGQTATKEDCDSQLSARLIEFNQGVESCITRPLRDNERVAFVSLAYNIGAPAFCGSTLVKRLQATPPDYPGACAQILRWTYAGGKQLPGLIKRRAAERQLCEAGLA